MEKLKGLFNKGPDKLPNIDAIPQDEEIVLFSSEPTQAPTANPFLTSHIVEAIRRERQAQHEMGE